MTGRGRRQHPVAQAAAPAPAGDGEALLRLGLQRAFGDLRQGRAELRQALRGFAARNDASGQLVAAAALVQFIGIADDEYAGFEDAVAVVRAAAGAADAIVDADLRTLARTGALIAGWFDALDDPALAARADALAAATLDDACSVPVRCCAGMAVLAYYQTRLNAEGVLWIELAMRPLLADAALSPRLRDEWHHMLVQALYLCGRPGQAQALRRARREGGVPLLPVIALKHHLLDAQTAIGDGRADTGREALAAAEPLLDPRAPRLASWWHLLHSRLDLLAGRQRDALTHARLALRLATAASYPERWMGVTIMQEGQVLMAGAAYADALPFFERAARAASGSQADFCWSQAQLARALALAVGGGDEAALGRALADRLALARRRDWPHFFRPSPHVAALVCALALERRIEAPFVRTVIGQRGLEATRADLAEWPWTLRVVTLGAFRIEIESRPLEFKGKGARKLLQLLQFIIASGGRDVSAASAMFALWPDLEGDKAKSAFNVALHRLRKLLRSDEAVRLDLGRLDLDARRVWVDCLAFEQLADRCVVAAPDAGSAAVVAMSTRALALYTGAFLHDAEDEAWQLVHRTRLASKFKRLSAQVAQQAVARGDPRAARAVLERALEHDPLAEDLARELMQLWLQADEPAAALAVYERCRVALERTLGARPSAATAALVDRIRGGDRR